MHDLTAILAVFFFLKITYQLKDFIMARILQIRRGTTAQNDNFTGLSGEITFDTDAKTIRVHDGQTLGGFPLARADDTSSANDTNFDINSVPDEFWTELFANFNLVPFNVLESSLLPVVNSTFLDYTFNCDQIAKIVQTFLVCQTPEAGYSINEKVSSFGIADRTNPIPNTYLEEDGLHVRLPIDQKSFWVSHKETGATTNITNDNWKILFRVYC